MIMPYHPSFVPPRKSLFILTRTWMHPFHRHSLIYSLSSRWVERWLQKEMIDVFPSKPAGSCTKAQSLRGKNRGFMLRNQFIDRDLVRARSWCGSIPGGKRPIGTRWVHRYRMVDGGYEPTYKWNTWGIPLIKVTISSYSWRNGSWRKHNSEDVSMSQICNGWRCHCPESFGHRLTFHLNHGVSPGTESGTMINNNFLGGKKHMREREW